MLTFSCRLVWGIGYGPVITAHGFKWIGPLPPPDSKSRYLGKRGMGGFYPRAGEHTALWMWPVSAFLEHEGTTLLGRWIRFVGLLYRSELLVGQKCSTFKLKFSSIRWSFTVGSDGII